MIVARVDLEPILSAVTFLAYTNFRNWHELALHVLFGLTSAMLFIALAGDIKSCALACVLLRNNQLKLVIKDM